MLALLAPLDLLNGREKAILVWAVALIVFAALKSDGLGVALLGVLRALAHPKMLLLFGSSALYCAGVVLLAKRADLWHISAVKETVYWFFGVGVILAGEATSASPSDPAYFKALLRKAIRFTLLIEFLVGLYVFPLGVELVLVPLIALFIGMQVLAERDAAMTSAKKAVNGVLLSIGLFLMLYVAVKATADLKGLLTREHAETFLLTPAFTVAFVPFLCVVAWFSRRELHNLRRRPRIASNSPA